MKQFQNLFSLIDFKVEVRQVEKGIMLYFTPIAKTANPEGSEGFKEISIMVKDFDELVSTDLPKLINEFEGQSMRVMDIASQVEASIAQAEKEVATNKVESKTTKAPAKKKTPTTTKKVVKAPIVKPEAQIEDACCSHEIEEEVKAPVVKEVKKVVTPEPIKEVKETKASEISFDAPADEFGNFNFDEGNDFDL